MLKVLQVKI